jgi:hypothetical protein
LTITKKDLKESRNNVMSNPVIETNLAEILQEIRLDQKKMLEEINYIKLGQATIEGQIKVVDEKLSGQIKAVDEKLSGQIKAVDEKLSGQIKAVDEKLSGQIKAVDEKLSGQIKALDTKVEQIDKRVGNQEFTNRGVLVGLILVILGGAAKLFGFEFKP